MKMYYRLVQQSRYTGNFLSPGSWLKVNRFEWLGFPNALDHLYPALRHTLEWLAIGDCGDMLAPLSEEED